ncbi:hypothetical protein C7H79_01355 [Nitrosomonas supralitoralis]|uniref:DUF4019 domain-containing protein n=2 Tax=Nitrosomonas supralitoralis TaxID=2116706 RepID=A0A2P7NZ20_9PROT|nr:hypothetical protein C7H79_01355 [Nitrosomonas supralitoralis]
MQTQTLRFIVAILLTLMAMLYFYTDREKDFYSKSAETAIAQILTEISSWEKQSLLLHLAPEAKQTINHEQLDELMDLYRSFGRFQSIEEINFSRTVSAFSLIGEKRINYSGIAKFDAGSINFNITLVERGGFFLVYNFTLAKASSE